MNADICSICCGTGREETIDCPLECEYLQDAHSHERSVPFNPELVPNHEIDLPEQFLEDNEWLLILLGLAVLEGAMKSPGTTDYDLREAFESLIRAYRASESGLYIEARPLNPYAAAVVETVQARMADVQKKEREAQGTSTVHDGLIMKMIFFLQRLEYANNNGRAKSRAFIDFLVQLYPSGPPPLLEDDGESDPAGDDEPRIIL